MSFSIPTFNLTADIYSVTPPTQKELRLTTPCNLAMGRRINWPWSEGLPGQGADGYTPALMVPAGTDIRSAVCGGQADVVECPSKSGRWYVVTGVDDVAKGFDNEYRLVAIQQIHHFGAWVALGIPNWPTPIP